MFLLSNRSTVCMRTYMYPSLLHICSCDRLLFGRCDYTCTCTARISQTVNISRLYWVHALIETLLTTRREVCVYRIYKYLHLITRLNSIWPKSIMNNNGTLLMYMYRHFLDPVIHSTKLGLVH